MSKLPLFNESQLAAYVRLHHKMQLDAALPQLKEEGLRIDRDELAPADKRFSCSKSFPNGGGWFDFARRCASEEDAWALAAVTRGLVCPGSLCLSSPEFGTQGDDQKNVLEIRKIEDLYHVFHVTKKQGVKPESVFQTSQIHQNKVFASIGFAAEFVEKFVADWSLDPETYPEPASIPMRAPRGG